MSKGISVIFSAVVLVLLAIVIGGIVALWLAEFSKNTSSDITSQTEDKLNCAYADFYIKEIKLDCNSDCSSGTQHNFTLTVKNNGRTAINISKMYVLNSSGQLFDFNITLSSKISAGALLGEVINFSTSCFPFNSSARIDKVYINSVNCPDKARDSLLGRDVVFENC